MLVGLVSDSNYSSQAKSKKNIMLKQMIKGYKASLCGAYDVLPVIEEHHLVLFLDSKSSLFQTWFKFGTLLKMIATFAGISSGVPNMVTFWIRIFKKGSIPVWNNWWFSSRDFLLFFSFQVNFFWAGLGIKISRSGGSELAGGCWLVFHLLAGWTRPPCPGGGRKTWNGPLN